MNKYISTLVFIFIIIFCVQAQKENVYVSEVWVSDQKDGTYKNPIIHADYSDPDVVRVGEDYYMTASSFNCSPGLPILHSKDMVNWELINYALEQIVPIEHFKIPQHGNGVWAPCIRHHDGEIYIYWGDPDFGIYMVKTKDPYGRWDPPVLVKKAKGAIDPSPIWDDDGKAYLVHAWAGSRAGVKSLLSLQEMNPEGTQVITRAKAIFDGHENHPTVEGAKFYKRNGYYYIFAPAGGVATGWQLILRSKNIYGPYEEKVVLEQGSTKINGPHQGAWVEIPASESWFYHFQDLEAYGRVVHLQPMTWEADWPVMGSDQDGNGIGEPVLQHKKPNIETTYPIQSPEETDEFDGRDIGLQWQWQANPEEVWYAKIPGSKHLRLFAIKENESAISLWNTPHLLLQKFPAPSFTAETKITLVPDEAMSGKSAGLIVMGMDYARVSIIQDQAGYSLIYAQAIGAEKGEEEEIIQKFPLEDNNVFIKVDVEGPNALCSFSYSEDGKLFTSFGKTFKASPGKWIGAKIGLYCLSTAESKRGGYADFEYFRIQK